MLLLAASLDEVADNGVLLVETDGELFWRCETDLRGDRLVLEFLTELVGETTVFMLFGFGSICCGANDTETAGLRFLATDGGEEWSCDVFIFSDPMKALLLLRPLLLLWDFVEDGRRTSLLLLPLLLLLLLLFSFLFRPLPVESDTSILC